MTSTCLESSALKGLTAPRRNRYFYSKLLDVPHLEMEQDYGKLKQWLINRLGLGSGVLCGLDVTVRDGQLCLSPGVAIDGLGREIIVPGHYCIDPWLRTDRCCRKGEEEQELSRRERHLVRLLLCYRECVTDHAPVQVSDCNAAAACEAGTVVESFCLKVEEGPPPRRPDICELLHVARPGDPNDPNDPNGHHDPADPHAPADPNNPPADAVRLTPSLQIRHQLCRHAPHACEPPEETCVLLAVVELLADGRIGRVDPCTHRTLLFSNAVLLELILCLAARVDECCGPPDTEPEPARLKVARVEFLNPNNGVVAAVTDLSTPVVLRDRQQVSQVRVHFTEPADPDTVVITDIGDNPDKASFVVRKRREEGPPDVVHGKRDVAADRRSVTFVMQDEPRFFNAPNVYEMVLFGDVDSENRRPAIADPAGKRLDGEPVALPSGDNGEGGNFSLSFSVVRR